MNSAINYYSAAQRHDDAIREARRNPVLVRPAAAVDESQPRRTVLLARRARRRLALHLA
ncbi:MAG: hypothetical protein QOI27_2233 [Gaiellaceae bacterium]|jgi:hypothetical protein|nr:hypothetical protein [Gaiellaceae bacterium]MDX6470955.1 hypothetical protein [Gaiellaceae bacterium]MDX6471216.1 hypothetical protein [Gaiellaceae bacterium]